MENSRLQKYRIKIVIFIGFQVCSGILYGSPGYAYAHSISSPYDYIFRFILIYMK